MTDTSPTCAECGTRIPVTSLSDLCVPCQQLIRIRYADPKNFEGKWWRWRKTWFAPVHMATGTVNTRAMRQTRKETMEVFQTLSPTNREGTRIKKIILQPGWHKPLDAWTHESAKAAIHTLQRDLAREKDQRIAASNDAVLQNLRADILEQDIQTIRDMILKGSTSAEILHFLDTPTAER